MQTNLKNGRWKIAIKETKFLIVAPSGAGKDKIVNYLCSKYGLKRVKSYTDRPKRNDKNEDKSHIFITQNEFDKIHTKDIVAYTRYNNYDYCCTIQQLEDAQLYIVDVDGLEYLNHKGCDMFDFKIIYIDTKENIRHRRMIKRGDGEEKAWTRIIYDRESFEKAEQMANFVVTNNKFGEYKKAAKQIFSYIVQTATQKTNETTISLLEQKVCDDDFEKIVYISHKFGNDTRNIEKVEKSIKYLQTKYPNYLFVSPLHLNGFMCDELSYKEGLRRCLWLLSKCNEMWVTGCDWNTSEGVQIEIDYCQKYGIPYEIKGRIE